MEIRQLVPLERVTGIQSVQSSMSIVMVYSSLKCLPPRYGAHTVYYGLTTVFEVLRLHRVDTIRLLRFFPPTFHGLGSFILYSRISPAQYCRSGQVLNAHVHVQSVCVKSLCLPGGEKRLEARERRRAFASSTTSAKMCPCQDMLVPTVRSTVKRSFDLSSTSTSAGRLFLHTKSCEHIVHVNHKPGRMMVDSLI